MARFAKLAPDNAQANYYYALSLWKRRKDPEDSETPRQVEGLLKKALQIDSKLGAAHLQLGILYADQREFAKAVSAFQRAIEASPEMEEAHYRLAQAYRQTGDTAKAQQELALFEKLSRQSLAAAERARDEIPRLVYSLRR
jgi:lipopolysaccharide biosynthesis regulator YciM